MLYDIRRAQFLPFIMLEYGFPRSEVDVRLKKRKREISKT